MAATPQTPPPTPIFDPAAHSATGMKRMEGKRPAPLLPTGLPASPGPKTPRTPRRSSLGPPLYPPPSSPLPPIPALLPPTPTSPPPRPSLPPPPPPPPPARPSRSPPPLPVPAVRPGAGQEKPRLRSLSDASLATIDLSLHLDALIPFFREGHPSSSSSSPPSSPPQQQQQRYNVLDPALSPSPSSVPALSYPSPRTSVSTYSSTSTSSRRHSFDAYSLLGGQWPLPPTPKSPTGGGGENADVLLLNPLYVQRTPLPATSSYNNSHVALDFPLHVAAPTETTFLSSSPSSSTAISASLFSPSLPSLPLPLSPLPLPAPPPPPPPTSASLFSTMATQAQRKKHANANGTGNGLGKGPGKRRASEAWIWII